MDINERNQFIMEKLNEGMSLSDVQKLLAEEHGIKMTYLDLRLAAAELAVNWEKQDKPKPAAAAPADLSVASAETDALADETAEDDIQDVDTEEDMTEAEEEAPDGAAADEDNEAATAGETKVTLDEEPYPGTAVSGKVTFASGISGMWYMDRMGRLGMNLPEGSEQPSQEDISLFQKELQNTMKRAQDELKAELAKGKTKVTLNPIVRPGSVCSGDVTFASGSKGEWFLDNAGRLDYELAEGSEKPTTKDLRLFQFELEKLLREKGMA
jgi:hypothetical protein